MFKIKGQFYQKCLELVLLFSFSPHFGEMEFSYAQRENSQVLLIFFCLPLLTKHLVPSNFPLISHLHYFIPKITPSKHSINLKYQVKASTRMCRNYFFLSKEDMKKEITGKVEPYSKVNIRTIYSCAYHSQVG